MPADLLLATLTSWPLWLAASLILLPAFITSPSCGCCQMAPCGCTDPTTNADTITVILTGISDGSGSKPYQGCAECEAFNGTFVLSKVDDWTWEYTQDSGCDCPGDSNVDTLRAWVDEDCYWHIRWIIHDSTYSGGCVSGECYFGWKSDTPINRCIDAGYNTGTVSDPIVEDTCPQSGFNSYCSFSFTTYRIYV
jgi:hypothetical protein